MEKPCLDNFVFYEKREKLDDDGHYRYYIIEGVKSCDDPNSVYIWRNYNTFDKEPTTVPSDYLSQHNGYIDCDECNTLNKCCPSHIGNFFAICISVVVITLFYR